MRVLIVLAATAAFLLTASSALAADGGPGAFHSPSGNIRCTYDAAVLDCSTRQPDRSVSLGYEGAAVRYSFWGHSWYLKTPGAYVAYGRTPRWTYRWYTGPNPHRVLRITCDMRVDGLTCWNADGHGFFLSRQQRQAW